MKIKVFMSLWCPGEDAALSKLSCKNRVLRGDQLSKVVLKAVPNYASGQSGDLWLALKTGLARRWAPRSAMS